MSILEVVVNFYRILFRVYFANVRVLVLIIEKSVFILKFNQ